MLPSLSPLRSSNTLLLVSGFSIENDGNREQLGKWANTYQLVSNFVQHHLWEDTINSWLMDTPHSLGYGFSGVWWMQVCFFTHPLTPPFLLMILQADLCSRLQTSGIPSPSFCSLMLSCPSRFAPLFLPSVCVLTSYMSRTRSFIRFSELESLSLDMIRWLVT
jgi:hypothetical protein